jgi:TRAP-type C4-dicarboxylate transport system substrate-binding protein
MAFRLKPALAATAAVLALGTAGASAQNFIISSALPQSHLWVGQHMDLFMEAMEDASAGAVTFTPFYAGELTGVGREYDALDSGTIAIAGPLLAPYHEGLFPLSDVTQLPTYNTTSPMVTRAFQRMLDSDEELVDGQTFHDYEIGDKGIRVWALGATAAYSISTTDRELTEPGDFAGLPLRAGSAIHTMAATELGSTSVTMPAVQVYEAMARGTVGGILLAISDWPAYSLEQLLRYTITDVSIGHWESYFAISDDAWNQMSAENQEIFDRIAREIGMANAQIWEDGVEEVIALSEAEFDGRFVPVTDLSQEMQDHIAAAAARTWRTWIDRVEAQGHPGTATARLYARFIVDEGGELPEGVAEMLDL